LGRALSAVSAGLSLGPPARSAPVDCEQLSLFNARDNPSEIALALLDHHVLVEREFGELHPEIGVLLELLLAVVNGLEPFILGGNLGEGFLRSRVAGVENLFAERLQHGAIGDELALSDNKADEVVTPWPGIAEAFKAYKLNLGNRIKPETYEASYERYLTVALLHLQGRKPARTGKELIERVLTHQRLNQKPGVKQGERLSPWIEMSASRQECCLALKLFLEFAVSEHRQPQALLIPEKDYLQLRGAGAKRRQKAVLTDDEVMELTRQLPGPWANVVKVARVFGVRTWEFEFIILRTNEEGNPQLWVSKGKTYNKSGGVKEETEPRWLHAISVNGQTFDLVEKWDELEWPPTISGKSLGAKLRLLPYWRELQAKYAAQGEWLRPYSFRDTFSVRSHGLEIEATLVCAAMGHSMEVHRRSYRTHEAQTVRNAYKRASQ